MKFFLLYVKVLVLFLFILLSSFFIASYFRYEISVSKHFDATVNDWNDLAPVISLLSLFITISLILITLFNNKNTFLEMKKQRLALHKPKLFLKHEDASIYLTHGMSDLHLLINKESYDRPRIKIENLGINHGVNIRYSWSIDYKRILIDVNKIKEWFLSFNINISFKEIQLKYLFDELIKDLNEYISYKQKQSSCVQILKINESRMISNIAYLEPIYLCYSLYASLNEFKKNEIQMPCSFLEIIYEDISSNQYIKNYKIEYKPLFIKSRLTLYVDYYLNKIDNTDSERFFYLQLKDLEDKEKYYIDNMDFSMMELTDFSAT